MFQVRKADAGQVKKQACAGPSRDSLKSTSQRILCWRRGKPRYHRMFTPRNGLLEKLNSLFSMLKKLMNFTHFTGNLVDYFSCQNNAHRRLYRRIKLALFLAHFYTIPGISARHDMSAPSTELEVTPLVPSEQKFKREAARLLRGTANFFVCFSEMSLGPSRLCFRPLKNSRLLLPSLLKRPCPCQIASGPYKIRAMATFKRENFKSVGFVVHHVLFVNSVK